MQTHVVCRKWAGKVAEERQRAAVERDAMEREAAKKLEDARLELDTTLARDRQASSHAERSMESAWQKVLFQLHY